MSQFHLKNIKRRMFVIISGKLVLAPKGLACSHGEWFKQEEWWGKQNEYFMEQIVRGYVDDEGIYIYQGREAYIPKISDVVLRSIIKELKERLNLNENTHIFLGVIKDFRRKDRHGKLPTQRDMGTILEISKKRLF